MKDKVVVITGASSGIGRATALKFASKGSKLALCTIKNDMENLEKLALEIKGLNSDVFIYPADVSQEEDCKIFIEKTIDYFGKIDVLINNAGITMYSLFKDTDLSTFKKVFDINFYGTVFCTKFAVEHIIKSKGIIAGISSIAGKKGIPVRTGYSASKFAVEGFMESLRLELMNENVDIVVIRPAFTKTNIHTSALLKGGEKTKEAIRNQNAMSSPESVAEVIYNAISVRKRDITLSAEGKFAILMGNLFPSLTDKLIFRKFQKEEEGLKK